MSTVNNVILFILVLAFYFCMTCYCTPFNALIPELGRTQELRVNVSATISITFFFGTAFAYLVPTSPDSSKRPWACPTVSASPSAFSR